MTIAVDSSRLIERLQGLGATGRDAAGRLCRAVAACAAHCSLRASGQFSGRQPSAVTMRLKRAERLGLLE